MSTYGDEDRGDVKTSIWDWHNRQDYAQNQNDRQDQQDDARDSWGNPDDDPWSGENAEPSDTGGDDELQGKGNRGNPAWGKPGNGYDPYAPVPRGSYRHTDKYHKTKTQAKRKINKTKPVKAYHWFGEQKKKAKKVKKKGFWF
jgi:hypothetical protein